MPTSSATAEVSAPAVPLPNSSPVAGPGETPTYTQILKSTSLIGGASVVSIAFGIIRTKAMAVFLGPAGIGLMGLYGSIADLAFSLAGMGIQNSAVRQIAESVGSGEAGRIARTVIVVKRASIVLGLIGAVLLVVLSGPVSLFTFGSDGQTTGVALLALAVLFRVVSAGQGAVIQGLRRITDLARMGVVAALFGTVISIPLVYFFREQGVVPSLVAVAGVSLLTSWWYSRRVEIETPSMTRPQVRHEAAVLFKLGLAFMANGFLTMGAAYAVRLIVLRNVGFEAAGLYQAAWTLGGLYVGFILGAMGADFYPRLTAVSSDNAACNRLVNEQAQIGLLLAGPGVLATLTLAPLVIAMFYSAEFDAAVSLLRWICLGMMLRIVTWPMGFIVLAKGAQQIFFGVEVAATLIHVGLAWLLVAQFGLQGSAAAFFGLCLGHGFLIYAIVRRLSGFRWSHMNRKLALIFLPLTGFVFCSFYLLPSWLAVSAGMLATVLTGIYSVRGIVRVLPVDSIPHALRPWLLRLGLGPGAGVR